MKHIQKNNALFFDMFHISTLSQSHHQTESVILSSFCRLVMVFG